jgi:hypothetical protein
MLRMFDPLTSFRDTVTALFDSLGLQGEEEELLVPSLLTVDGVDVELDLTADETALLCSATGCHLSADPRIRPEQVRKALRHNLAFSAGHLVCASLDDTDDGPGRIVLRFAYPFAGLSIAELEVRINALVNLAESYRNLIEAPANRLAPRVDEAERATPFDTIIFTP